MSTFLTPSLREEYGIDDFDWVPIAKVALMSQNLWAKLRVLDNPAAFPKADVPALEKAVEELDCYLLSIKIDVMVSNPITARQFSLKERRDRRQVRH